MRLLVVFVATILVVSSAEIDSKSDEVSELKDLLSKVKHYLDAKETQNSKVAGRRHDGDACEVEKIVYNSTAVKAQVDAGTGGQWTAEWINADDLQKYGNGEYEDCSRAIFQQDAVKKCWLGCSQPLAAKFIVDKGKGTCPANDAFPVSWEQILDCVGPNTLKLSSCGLTCLSRDVMTFQRDESKCPKSSCEAKGLGKDCIYCPSVVVKFFCPGTPPPVDQCCPAPLGANCKNGKVALHEALGRIVDVNSRMDAAAVILEQVREAMEEEQK